MSSVGSSQSLQCEECVNQEMFTLKHGIVMFYIPYYILFTSLGLILLPIYCILLHVNPELHTTENNCPLLFIQNSPPNLHNYLHKALVTM